MIKIQMHLDKNPHIDAGICNLAHDEINMWVHKDYAEDLAYFVHKSTVDSMKHYIKGIRIDGDNETEHLNIIGTSWEDK